MDLETSFLEQNSTYSQYNDRVGFLLDRKLEDAVHSFRRTNVSLIDELFDLVNDFHVQLCPVVTLEHVLEDVAARSYHDANLHVEVAVIFHRQVFAVGDNVSVVVCLKESNRDKNKETYRGVASCVDDSGYGSLIPSHRLDNSIFRHRSSFDPALGTSWCRCSSHDPSRAMSDRIFCKACGCWQLRRLDTWDRLHRHTVVNQKRLWRQLEKKSF